MESIKNSDQIHERFMKKAIALASRGMGRVSPNPLVGAVVVRKGEVVGHGYHRYQARDHAEVIALARAGSRARNAHLYVNLEPCAHHGRTPPCVDRIVEAGISKVFVAMRDPLRHTRQKGIPLLRRNRIEVDLGLCSEIANRQNEVFLHFARTGRPFVLLKLALTLDGRIATGSGDSRWITQTLARKQVHRLRYAYDAILIGIGTVLHDNPSLDVRWTQRNPITKVILDSRLRTPGQAKLFTSSDRVIIFHSRKAAKKRVVSLAKKAELIPVSKKANGLDWQEILDRLGQLKVTSLVVEGGAGMAASALQAKTVQKINFFYGPKMIGSSGRAGIGDLGIDRLRDALKWKIHRLRHFPPDFMVEAYPG
ncbi:MAG: bifunctional diaminohydroxyphosphoribosylaminopyrimidine deaminase/5-amino-6-(5-phosphoribosylamino)uracil reductase RibD [Acidobacteriota bacterium]